MTKQGRHAVQGVVFVAALAVLTAGARAEIGGFDGEGKNAGLEGLFISRPAVPPIVPVSAEVSGSDDPIPLPPNVRKLAEFIEANQNAILTIKGIVKVNWGWPDGDASTGLWIGSGDPQAVLKEFFRRFPQAHQWDLMWWSSEDHFGGFIQRQEQAQIAATSGWMSGCRLDESQQACVSSDGNKTAVTCRDGGRHQGYLFCDVDGGGLLMCDASRRWSCAPWSP